MKILLSLLLGFSTASVFGDDANVRPSWSGSWFNPEQSGHGYLCSGDNVLVCQHGDDKRACQCVKQDEAERQLGMWDDFEDS